MRALTSAISEFVVTVDPKNIPERCTYGAKIGMLDCVGTMIAGAGDDAVRIVAAIVPASTSNDGAPEVPSGRNLSTSDAALVNGVAAHVLDYDDVGIDGHPSAAMTPAILAEGYALGSSGAEALAAYVVGYEIWTLLNEIEPGVLHERGFHPTAVMGTISAAAACARLNHLDHGKTTNAIAIAASLASGIVANFGTMTKSLHAGRANQAGVLAARLAKAGFTGSGDVLEHAAGFMRAHSPSGTPKLENGEWRLGQEWRMPKLGLNIKRYPMCYAAHRSIDAVLDLVRDNDLAPDGVHEIHAQIGDAQDLMLRNRAPKTSLEAKFSLEFALACALVARRVSLKEVTDEFVRRADVFEMMKKVRRSTTSEKMPQLPFAPADRVTIMLKDGSKVEHPPVEWPKGSWHKPLTEEELREKFIDCSEQRLGREQADVLFAKLHAIEQLQNLRGLPLGDCVR